jgi:hypothetical protein
MAGVPESRHAVFRHFSRDPSENIEEFARCAAGVQTAAPNATTTAPAVRSLEPGSSIDEHHALIEAVRKGGITFASVVIRGANYRNGSAASR